MSHKDKYQNNFDALFVGDPADTEITVYILVTDGHTRGFAGLLAHTPHLRSIACEMSARNGKQIAKRHAIKAIIAHGQITDFEIL